MATERSGEVTVLLPTGIPMEFVWIPPGSFTMGITDEVETTMRRIGIWADHAHPDTQPAHVVNISTGFHLGKFEVTQAQWAAVTGDPITGEGDLPVVNVSWHESVGFTEALDRLDSGATHGLPTEAEWEYACKAGTVTIWHFGDDAANLFFFSVYAKTQTFLPGKPEPVGGKLPNPWGLFDMYGNVMEWVSDYSAPYDPGEATDPRGPETGVERVLRGGGWRTTPRQMFSAYRSSFFPDGRGPTAGLRVVRKQK